MEGMVGVEGMVSRRGWWGGGDGGVFNTGRF